MLAIRPETQADIPGVALGHPEYYPRLGFRPAGRYGIRPPFAAPDEAFMVYAADEAPAGVRRGLGLRRTLSTAWP